MSHTHKLTVDLSLEIADSVETHTQQQIYAALSVIKMALTKTNIVFEGIEKSAMEVAAFPANNSDEKVKEALKTLANHVRVLRNQA